jgi:hypothetical protein
MSQILKEIIMLKAIGHVITGIIILIKIAQIAFICTLAYMAFVFLNS